VIFYWFIQYFLIWPIAGIILRIFYKIEVRGRENLTGVRAPLIIVSNHKTLLDGFLIVISMPWLSPILPGRYITEEFDFRSKVLRLIARLRILKLFYLLTGGFPSGRGQGIEKAIKFPTRILEKGGTVLMFPEGFLIRGDELGYFYHGTSALALEAKVLILPIHIKTRRGYIRVTFGKVFNLDAASREAGTEILKKKIQDLQ